MNDLTFESEIDGMKVKLLLKPENMDIERRCDTEYHLAFTELMQRGIMPKAALEKIMSDRGVWTSNQEEKLNDMQRDLAKLQLELDEAKTHDQGLELARQMAEVRAACLTLVEVKAAVLANSCESLADNIRRDAYIAYALVYADTGKRVFRDYEDLLERCEEQAVIDARRCVLEESISAFQGSLTSLPEVTYIKKVEGDMLEAEIEAELAEQDKAATATKKKTTRKKKTTKKTAKKAPARKKKTT